MQDPQKTVILPRAQTAPAARRQGASAGGRAPSAGHGSTALVGLAVVVAGVAGVALLFPASFGTGASEIVRFSEHTAGVVRLALSADGASVASEDQSGVVRVWRPETRQETFSLAVAAREARCLAVSSDGRLVATGALDGTRIWDVEKRVELRRLWDAKADPIRPATSVAFYPAMTHVLVGGRDEIVLWRLATGQPIRHYATTGDVAALAVLPDGTRFLAGDARGVIRLWNLAQEREIAHCQAHTQPVHSLAVDLSGSRLVSCGDDHAVRLWNVDDLAPLRELEPPGSARDALSVAISPGGGRVLTGDAEGDLRLWSCESGELLETFASHAAAVTSCALTPNGLLAISSSLDRSVRIWRMPLPTEFELKRVGDALETQRRLNERMQQFVRRFELAQQAIVERRLDQAVVELRAAEGLLPSDSLEGVQVRDAIQKIEKAQSDEREYRTHCEAGQAAAEREDYAEALRQFEAARAINRDQPEAQRGAELASRALRLERVLKGARVADSQLDFVEPRSAPIPLREDETVAFLLSRLDAPMASPATPLEWKLRVDLPEAFPQEQAALRVEVFDLANGARLARADASFVPGQTQQALSGRAPAPEGGWLAGRYQTRASLVTSRRVTPQGEPKDFSIGLIHWRKTIIPVTATAVADAGFSLESGVTLERGDGFALRASGAVTPAPVSFYRDLLDDPKLREAVAAKPAGIPWSNNDQRLRKYRVVEASANYAALLFRVDDREWLPYVIDTAPLPAPQGGAIRLSLNSILPPRFESASDRGAISAPREYWRPNSGQYEVTLFVGRFVFPDSLSLIHRAALLTRFSN